MSSGTPNSSVPHAIAGSVFQFERALLLLARLESGGAVGIETLDDVSSRHSDGSITQEQDKASVVEDENPLTDKSKNLWRTLDIWMQSEAVKTSCDKVSLVFATNRPIPSGTLVRELATAQTDAELEEAFKALHKAGQSKDEDVQKIMTRVLGDPDLLLKKMIRRISLCDADGTPADATDALRKQTITALSLPTPVDGDMIYHQLAGWVQSVARNCWDKREPCWIDHSAFNDYKHAAISAQRWVHLRERPETQVLVSEDDVKAARPQHFVAHLAEVGADDELVVDSIKDYIRFKTEYLRLLRKGEIGDTEWKECFQNLMRRWKNINRKHVVTRVSGDGRTIGLKILYETAQSDYCVTLANQVTSHSYLTTGAYHNLADEDKIWWHPDYKKSVAGGGK